MYSVISNQFNLGDDTAVYPEVSVILNIVKDDTNAVKSHDWVNIYIIALI